MDTEIQALKYREVLDVLPRAEVQEGQQTIETMWVFSFKTDHLGYVVGFRARIVARGDTQIQGIDFMKTFAPVARMATFRLFVATCTMLGLPICQADVKTAYLNAGMGIKQYLGRLKGYPCDDPDHMYVVNNALYLLRQSGREWNSEFDEYTEPCLYLFNQDSHLALVLIYVYDLLCVTKNEELKRVDESYGLKDQGLLHKYLGVEVVQAETPTKIYQKQYCEEILERIKFADAHSSRIPMETTTRFTASETGEAGNRRKQAPGFDKDFPYRE
ncbi:Integrase, catalytic core protein [Phytophthora megakarya]|uniref:Integrase, catalytic core protein n=1 Tax=Phytophthora megakarya TaxID=4795 RepID=A0A225VEA7_9STRA|nr:Integrase, catalytic core protein [Phytophthora megakarya]